MTRPKIGECLLKILNKDYFLYVFVLVFTLMVIVSRLLFQGEILTFDYGIFQPDGSNYTFRTLVFMGEDESSAAKKVSDWYLTHGVNHNIIDFRLLLPENSPVWHLTAPRVLYPLLSIPFVYFFGIPGMLAVPILSLLIMVFTILKIGFVVNKKFHALFFIIVLLCSTTLNRWMVANLTDSLLAVLATLFLLLIVNEKQVSPRIWNLLAIFLVICGSLTRFSLPLWISLGFFVFFRISKTRAVLVIVSSLLGALPLFFFSPSSGITNSASEESIPVRMFLFFVQTFKVLFFEIAQLFVLDRILLIILILGMLISFADRRSSPSFLFFVVFFSCFVTGSLNGVVGVNFRYYLPVIPFVMYSLITTDWLKICRPLNIKIHESQNELKPSK